MEISAILNSQSSLSPTLSTSQHDHWLCFSHEFSDLPLGLLWSDMRLCVTCKFCLIQLGLVSSDQAGDSPSFELTFDRRLDYAKKWRKKQRGEILGGWVSNSSEGRNAGNRWDKGNEQWRVIETAKNNLYGAKFGETDEEIKDKRTSKDLVRKKRHGKARSSRDGSVWRLGRGGVREGRIVGEREEWREDTKEGRVGRLLERPGKEGQTRKDINRKDVCVWRLWRLWKKWEKERERDKMKKEKGKSTYLKNSKKRRERERAMKGKNEGEKEGE